MKTESIKSGQNDKKLIILGFFSIGILFLIYVRFEYQEITPDAIQSIERLGIAFYVLFSISIGMIGVGLRKFQKRVASTGNTTALSMICNNTLGNKAKKNIHCDIHHLRSIFLNDIRDFGLSARSCIFLSLWSRCPFSTCNTMLWTSRIHAKICGLSDRTYWN